MCRYGGALSPPQTGYDAGRSTPTARAEMKTSAAVTKAVTYNWNRASVAAAHTHIQQCALTPDQRTVPDQEWQREFQEMRPEAVSGSQSGI